MVFLRRELKWGVIYITILSMMSWRYIFMIKIFHKGE